ncbi:MAG TPA: lysylphosphatidylglycerol synthase transmembrane domain-containing protein [Pyrinomonadaceae bacterium]|nr:lysylphosphatidylglycerol synthase transmembrane domain-containing protein [Pyrinomonadaceae bacterium]
MFLISIQHNFIFYLARSGNNLRKSLKFILLFLFAVFILWFFGCNLNWQEVSGSLRKADATYLIVATLVTCFGYFLRALRWKVLLEPLTKTSLRELFAATTVGFAVIMIVGRAGELARPMWLSMRDRRVRPSAAFVTLGVERIFDLASLICFFSVNLLWFNVPAGRESQMAYIKMVGNLMLVGTIFGFVALYFYQKHSRAIIGWTDNAINKKFIPRRLRSIILSILKQLAASLQILKDWREVVSIMFWTFMLWLSIAVPTWLVILAFDLPVSFSDSLFIMGFAALGSIVPTPGGAAGAFHAATAGGLIFLNVDKDQAAAVSIAMHLVYFAPAVFFGFYYFLRGDVSVARLKILLSGEQAVEEIEHEKGLQVQSSKFKVQSSSNQT